MLICDNHSNHNILKPAPLYYRLHFSDYNISVIYGENGCGKTTILRLINAFLAQNDSVLSQEKVLLMSMTYQFEGVETKVLVEKKERTENIKDEDVI